MVLTGLFHIAIKTNDLDMTVRFYTEILGLKPVDRPPFGFPGAWLATSTPGAQAIFHIYAGGPALGPEGRAPVGTAAIDHVSLSAVGFHGYQQRIAQAGISWREFIVPNTSLWQLFVYDPNGVMLELTFEGDIEGEPLPDLSPGRRYEAGISFFQPQDYDRYRRAALSL